MPSLFASGEFVLEYPTIYGVATNQRLLGFIHALSKHPDLQIECYDDLLNYDQKSYPFFLLYISMELVLTFQ